MRQSHLQITNTASIPALQAIDVVVEKPSAKLTLQFGDIQLYLWLCPKPRVANRPSSRNHLRLVYAQA